MATAQRVAIVAILVTSSTAAADAPSQLTADQAAKAIWAARDSGNAVSFAKGQPSLGPRKTASSDSNLKWRAKRSPSLRTTQQPSLPNLSAPDGSVIRQAAELAPISPLDDPFRDKPHTPFRDKPQTQSQRTASRPRQLSPISLDPPLRTVYQEAIGDPAADPADPGVETLPSPEAPCDHPERDKPGDIFFLDATKQLGERKNDESGRNCSAHGRLCDCHKEEVRNYTIQKISLDITPSYLPNVDDPAERAKADQERLNSSKPRQWTNRRGEVVADGKVIDFRNRNLIIEDVSGQEVEVPFVQLSDLDACYLAGLWRVPSECRMSEEPRDLHAGRETWIASTMTYKASALCHKPLYFEQRALERYGHSAGPIRQPIISTAHFFANIAILPYKMGMNPPNECRYALGYYRPGDCAPWMIDPIPLSLRGALMQTGAVLGAAFVIP